MSVEDIEDEVALKFHRVLFEAIVKFTDSLCANLSTLKLKYTLM